MITPVQDASFFFRCGVSLWCVSLGLDADLTPRTERTMCGSMVLTFLFRGLVRLWRYLDLRVLICVFILTMDVLLN